MNNNNNNNNNNTQIATIANGCFWCSEAIFKRLKGIKSVLPGYSGGVVEKILLMMTYVQEKQDMQSQFK